MPTYKIIRFYQDEDHPDDKKVIRTGLTLAEAREHTNTPDTHGGTPDEGTGWFDGLEEE
jgi:hypothetical protein